MIGLNIHSHYSLMQGTANINQICSRAKALGYTRLALTDTDNLYGMWYFINACRHQGLAPVIGAEITDPSNPHKVVCLVKNSMGYSNLTQLITQRHRDNNFSLKKNLIPYSRGLSIVTENIDLLTFWREHSIDLWANIGNTHSHNILQTARRFDIPVVAAADSFFLKPEDIKNHYILRAIEQKTSLSRLDKKQILHKTAYLHSPTDLRQRFNALPNAIDNIFTLAEKIEFHKPDFGVVMPPLKEHSSLPSDQMLRRKTLEGAKKRYGQTLPAKVIERINYELSIIREKNFCEYFLVVQTIVQKASRICGRGSGAASIVAYCLGITNVCPVKHNLYFERFLNPDRSDPPDIDIDFAWDERDKILNWVLSEFPGHSALVSSHILFQPRMAVREVARVFGLPEQEISRISKRLPWFWKQNEASQELLVRIKNRPEFKNMDFPPPWPEIMSYAQAIVGTPRYLSVHPGGVVITPLPLDTYVPVENAPKGVPVIQWEKDSAETAGLVKIDLLGNRSLGVIRDTIHNIETSAGKFNDFSYLDPEDDYDTQQAVAQGNTMGCFYIESPAMRLLQQKSKVGDFNHLIIHSSIIRPAANEFIQEYIKRLHTGVWKPIHPILEDLLDETFGIMVFQEDVSRVAVKMAGFTHAKADRLRKIISKKDKELELADYYKQFQKGALANGVKIETIKRVWKMIISFSGYSFCKPHSASYARVSFQAAYLKTHYPAQFMAAVISNQGGFYSTFAYVSEARRLDVTILPPDVNKSSIQWTGNDFKIRVGFLSIKYLSSRTMRRILMERKQKLFSSPEDFFNRINPQEDEARALIHCGSLDALNNDNNRALLLWRYSAWRKSTAPKKTVHSLFNKDTPEISLPDLPEDNTVKRLHREFSVLGFLCVTHPICLYQKILSQHKTVKANQIADFTGKRIAFAGWFITGKIVRTKHGDPMKFLTFEDETGLVETVFFPKPYALFCHMLDYGRPYLIYGRPTSSWGAVTFTVDRVCLVNMHGSD